jgi:hypothetical protein
MTSKRGPAVAKVQLIFAAVCVLLASGFGQSGTEGQFTLALPEHRGQLRWSAPGFRVVESSAKPNEGEIGIRGENAAAHLTFLGFLFLVPEQAPLTGTKCRDGALGPEKQSNSTLKILEQSENVGRVGLPVSLVKYTDRGSNGKTTYMERAFVATGDICGDLEFYSDNPITDENALRGIFSSYQLDPTYVPKFSDAFIYGQILYNSHKYAAAASIFELALAKLREHPEGDVKTMTRVVTDQAGMAYGISGNISKSREIFEKAIGGDPDYPIYYYNLACGDAAEKNLAAARVHLQQAFDRKANVLQGETIPDPTKDDSFLPYRDNKEFWTFLETLRSKP